MSSASARVRDADGHQVSDESGLVGGQCRIVRRSKPSAALTARIGFVNAIRTQRIHDLSTGFRNGDGRIFPCATGLRRKATSAIPGTCRSARYSPLPSRNRASSLRSSEAPMPCPPAGEDFWGLTFLTHSRRHAIIYRISYTIMTGRCVNRSRHAGWELANGSVNQGQAINGLSPFVRFAPIHDQILAAPAARHRGKPLEIRRAPVGTAALQTVRRLAHAVAGQR